ncbi:MAG: hypothetical protein H6R13_1804 [Proteobacteria bacterium]|nr:hypothetical protein [Pseudomonadota bacterium]
MRKIVLPGTSLTGKYCPAAKINTAMISIDFPNVLARSSPCDGFPEGFFSKVRGSTRESILDFSLEILDSFSFTAASKN